MLSTVKNALFLGHSHPLTTYTANTSLSGARAIVKVSGLSVSVVSRWLRQRTRIFLEVASMVVTWWIVAFCAVPNSKSRTNLFHVHSVLLILCVPNIMLNWSLDYRYRHQTVQRFSFSCLLFTFYIMLDIFPVGNFSCII